MILPLTFFTGMSKNGSSFRLCSIVNFILGCRFCSSSIYIYIYRYIYKYIHTYIYMYTYTYIYTCVAEPISVSTPQIN